MSIPQGERDIGLSVETVDACLDGLDQPAVINRWSSLR